MYPFFFAWKIGPIISQPLEPWKWRKRAFEADFSNSALRIKLFIRLLLMFPTSIASKELVEFFVAKFFSEYFNALPELSWLMYAFRARAGSSRLPSELSQPRICLLLFQSRTDGSLSEWFWSPSRPASLVTKTYILKQPNRSSKSNSLYICIHYLTPYTPILLSLCWSSKQMPAGRGRKPIYDV